MMRGGSIVLVALLGWILGRAWAGGDCYSGQWNTGCRTTNYWGTCTSCNAGSWLETSGNDECCQCSAGRYQPYATTGGHSVCNNYCPVGKYSGAGSSACSLCAAGKYQPYTGRGSCYNCPAGKWQSGTGQSSCSSCPAGKYQPYAARGSCYSCSAGKTSPAGATAASQCSNCGPGTYNPTAGSSCSSCPIGKQQPNYGGTDCASCSPGYYTPRGGQSYCSQCPAGQYMPNWGYGNTYCWSCSAGQEPTSDQSNCQYCGLGKYSDNGKDCLDCAFAHYSDSVGATECKLCSKGKIAYGGASACDDCPAGEYGITHSFVLHTSYAPTDSTAADGGCQNGHTLDSCKNACLYDPTCNGYWLALLAPFTTSSYSCCMKDTWGDGTRYAFGGSFYSFVTTSCAGCEAGKYSSEGSVACTTCSPGRYTNSNKSGCDQCPDGKYKQHPPPSYDSISDCINCGCGHEPDGQASSCQSCPWGKNTVNGGVCQNASPGRTTTWLGCGEMDCSAGTYAAGSAARDSCGQSPAGGYVSSAGSTTYAICGAGKYSDGGATTCSSCPSGKFNGDQAVSLSAHVGSSSCSSCGSGKYSPAGSSSCTPCPAGNYQPSSNSGSCLACRAGGYCPEGATEPTVCAEGSYSAASAPSCTLCSTGKYNPVFSNEYPDPANCRTYSGSECTSYRDLFEQRSVISYTRNSATVTVQPCQQCPAGTFQSSTGQTSCQNCMKGYYINSPGATGCTRCGPGTYNSGDTLPTTACESCPEGRYASGTGSDDLNDCIQCAMGKHGISDRSDCVDCELGKYSSSLGMPNCAVCGAGKYASTTGLDSCTSCPSHSVITDDGSSAANHDSSSDCLPCMQGKTPRLDQSGCDSCDEGSYRGSDSSPENYSCEECPLGRFSSARASSTCTICGLGKYAGNVGQTVCESCPSGRYNDDDATNDSLHSSVSSCSCCEAGTYYNAILGFNIVEGAHDCDGVELRMYEGNGDNPGSTHEEKLQACFEACRDKRTPLNAGNGAEYSWDVYDAIGFVMSSSGRCYCEEQVVSSDNTCYADNGYQRYNYHSEGSSACLQCPISKATSSTCSSTCDDCPSGRFTTVVGALTCDACPAGKRGVDGSCVQCPCGKVSSENDARKNATGSIDSSLTQLHSFLPR